MNTTTTPSSLDLLRAYTAQFGVELGPDDEFLTHSPIDAADATELVQKWQMDSVLPPSEKRDDRSWSVLQQLADDYDVPLDEFLGAVHFVSQHNGAYKHLPRAADQIGCALGEILRALGAFDDLKKQFQ